MKHDGPSELDLAPDSARILEIELPGAHGTIAYSPDGSQIAVGGTSSRIELGPKDHGFLGHTDRGATLTILDTASGEVRTRTQPESDGFFHEWHHHVSWSPSGEYLVFSVGKGYVGGVLRLKDMKTRQSLFSGGQMWSILDGFWVSERLYRPCFVSDYQKGDRSLVFDVKARPRAP